MATELTNIEKAALVLVSLGKDQASDVMKFLTETEVKRLSRTFLTVTELDRDVQREVVGEFHRMLHAAERLVVDGREFAKDVISSAFGAEAGDSLLEYITGSKKEPLSVLLGDIPQNTLDNFMTTEHPQTIAFLLSSMPPDKAAQALAKLTEEMQTEVMVRISQLNNVKMEIVDEVREVLRNQLRGVSMRQEEAIGGAKAAANILNFVERTNEERIITEVEEMYPELAEEIRNLMFTFEDLKKLDDRSIQAIMKEVPRDQLVVALKRASTELRDLLFKNISQRAAQMLQEDLENLGPTKLKDVEKAQQGIVDVVRRLEAEGKVVVGGGSDDVMV